MHLKPEEIYFKFTEKNVEVKIPNELLLPLLQQINRHLEVLKYEEEVINNFAIRENINNTEMIMAKLLILMAEPYGKKEIILETSIAEFLVLRDLIFCNYSLLHLKTKMHPRILEAYKEFYEYIESIYKMLARDEVKAYWGFIRNYNMKVYSLH